MNLRDYKSQYEQILFGVYRDNYKYHGMTFEVARSQVERDLKARPASDLPHLLQAYTHEHNHTVH